MIEDNGEVQFDGLPQVMKKHLIAFSQEELKEYPHTCLNVILKQTYQPKEALKSSDEANMLIQNAADIKQDNPSKYYKVVGKEGVGGFARVFRCQRISDQKLFALKFTEPKNSAERAAIINEIGIMQLGNCQSVVQCYEAFDF